MIGAQVSIRNLDEIRKQFADAPRRIEEALTTVSAEQLAAMAQQLALYPGTRPGQRYRRTGRLGRGWEAKPVFRVGGSGVSAVLRNAVRYAPYVQVAGQQSWFHAGRWINTTDAVQLSFEQDNAVALERAAARVAKEF